MNRYHSIFFFFCGRLQVGKEMRKGSVQRNSFLSCDAQFITHLYMLLLNIAKAITKGKRRITTNNSKSLTFLLQVYKGVKNNQH